MQIKKLVGTKSLDRSKGAKYEKTSSRWSSLRHNGVLFPPAYESINIPVLYKGKPVKLDSKKTDNPFKVSAEEAAVFLAMKLEQDDRLAQKSKEPRKKAKDDPVFMENFWNDWKVILGSGSPIKDIKNVDFTPLQKYISQRSEDRKSAKKAMTKEEKQEEKKQKEAVQELYNFAIVDGVKISLGGNVIQPPGLFIGHGNTPRRGKIKARVTAGDVTLNISKEYVPKCYDNGKPCTWGGIVEDKGVNWIASYRNPVTQEMVYVYLNRNESHWVCADDMIKFDKARKLDENIKKIRSAYEKDLKSSDLTAKQLGTAVYLLDILAIRPGTEKDETKEAGTLGLTTLKCENVEFQTGDNITINFAGKSSIHFVKTFKVSSNVYKNLKGVCTGSKKAPLFPLVTATTLNAYLKTLLPGLTAKVFRTWKASKILQEELSKNIPDPNTSMHEKKLIYDRVNVEVAKALNHKKMGGSSERIEKLNEKLKELKAKKKAAKTDKQKETVQKSIDINSHKLEEAVGNISTSTSKQNYLDPRITVSWCKNAEMQIEKIYNKTQLKKFIWAMDIDPSWRF